MGAILVVCGLIVYAIFFANLFDIRTVKINGPDTVAHQELQNIIDDWLDTRIVGIARRNNSLLFSSQKLSSLIADHYTKISDVSIQRHGLHELELSFSDRKPLGIWCITAQSSCFYFDQDDIAYSESGTTSGYVYTTIDDQRERTLALGDLVADRELINYIMGTRDQLQSLGLSITEFEIPKASYQEFQAKTSEGWLVMFNTTTDITKQIQALSDLLKTKISADQRQHLEYIDLRIQDRIYFQ